MQHIAEKLLKPIVGVNSTRECEMLFICPKHSVKPIMLLFYLTEFQFREILARVEIRMFQFLVMSQFAVIPFQSYSQCPPDTSKQCHPVCFETSRELLSPCAETDGMDCTVCSIVVATGSHLVCDSKEPVASNFFIILFNAEDAISLLSFSIHFMK